MIELPAYSGIMVLEIDDETFGPLTLTGEEVRLDLALGLFMSRRLTLGRASDVAGIDQTQFLRELGQRGIPLHYDLEDLELDQRVVDQILAS